jgi:hypothetical protein
MKTQGNMNPAQKAPYGKKVSGVQNPAMGTKDSEGKGDKEKMTKATAHDPKMNFDGGLK